MSKPFADSARSDQAALQAEPPAERRLREVEQQLNQLRALVAAASVGLWDWDLRTNQVAYSSEWKRQIGYEDHEISNDFSEWQSRVHPDDLERALDAVRRFVEKPWPNYRIEFRFRHRDGSYRWILTQASLTLDERSKPARMLGSHIDITEQKRAEQVLRESEERLRSLIDGVPHLVAIFNPDGPIQYANSRWRAYFGSAAWTTASERALLIHPQDRAEGLEYQRRVRSAVSERRGKQGAIDLDTSMVRLCRHDGVFRWFSLQGVLISDSEGKPSYVISTCTDIDELKKSQESLREAQARLQAALRVGGIGTLVWEIPRDVMHWDESLLLLLGRTDNEVSAGGIEHFLNLIHEGDRAEVRRAITDAVQGGVEYELECRALRADGALISIASKAQLERDAHGAPLRMISAIVDITQRKQLEADLLQSQKLESIGQLAGGVAHDFNNLLTIILGQASLLSTMASLPTAVRESARDIEMAAERAAALTAQLLAFGRRQFLQLRVLDINGVVSETLKMLTRVVGDRVTIRFEPDESPLPVRADATAIAQILLNLTLNARDAMPQGGVCTVRTLLEQGDASAHARDQTNDDRDAKGPWACLVVSDTGLGIAPNVLPHIFDPFFTTKDIGKGSGLGLSTVYGIARQHRGFVTVATTLGKGSAFKVFLPRDASEIDVVVAVPPSPKAGRGEQILVVEDEPGVRLLLMSTLARHGYQPVSAASGADALRVWRERGPVFALVFTDMAMPGDMNGLELVEALRSQEPSLKAIISSGYSQEIVATELSARSAQSFLQKPWSAEQLLSAIRDMLDREG